MVVTMPQIVYLQTITACNGHCRYCPFDDVYAGQEEPLNMSLDIYCGVIEWLNERRYQGRIGFLLHYEPTMDPNLKWRIEYARNILPHVPLEAATNGIINDPVLKRFNQVARIPARSRLTGTSRAGNVRACPEIAGRGRLRQPPCPIPIETMCIAANGEALLCCQDWRHEAVVGTYEDLTATRAYQLSLIPKIHKQEVEICQDCMAGKTAEEVGDRLGKRFISGGIE